MAVEKKPTPEGVNPRRDISGARQYDGWHYDDEPAVRREATRSSEQEQEWERRRRDRVEARRAEWDEERDRILREHAKRDQEEALEEARERFLSGLSEQEAEKPNRRKNKQGLFENKKPSYTTNMDEAAKACAPAADYFGLPLEVVTETLAALRAKASRETTTRGRSAAPAVSAASTAEGLQWPSEKWKGSPEELSRKQHAIEAYMRRVWKPFVEQSGAVVTLAMLRKIDPQAASAWAVYVSRNGPVPDNPIVSTNDLARTDRPAVFIRQTFVKRNAAMT